MDKITLGDELAAILHKEILNVKINTVADKIRNYFETLAESGVDIPDFVKPKELQLAFWIEKEINKMLEQGTLDYFYKLAIGE